MDTADEPLGAQSDDGRPWLAPIVDPPPPRPRRRRPWIIGISLALVAVTALGVVLRAAGADDTDDRPVLVTVLREAGTSQSVTSTRRVTIEGVGTSNENVFCDALMARCTYEAVEGTRTGTMIVDGIALSVWMDPEFVRSVGGPDTGGRWGVTPLREVTDTELWRFGQAVLFYDVLRLARLGDWLDSTLEDGVATQRIVVTAEDQALSDTEERFLGSVTYLDRIELTFEFDADRLLGYTLGYDSAAGRVTEEYSIVGFDLMPTVQVPEDAVPVPGSAIGG